MCVLSWAPCSLHLRCTLSNDDPAILSSCTQFEPPTGQHHALALTSTGEVFGWGANGCGQMGLGCTRSWLGEPVELTAALRAGWEVRALALGCLGVRALAARAEGLSLVRACWSVRLCIGLAAAVCRSLLTICLLCSSYLSPLLTSYNETNPTGCGVRRACGRNSSRHRTQRTDY